MSEDHHRTFELPAQNPLKSAHAALYPAVLEAYNFNPQSDLLAQLLQLNLQVAAYIEQNKSATAPGIPSNYGDSKSLISDDCIEP